MLKTQVIVVGAQDAISELLKDCSGKNDWSLTFVPDKNGHELEELIARIRKGEINTAIVDGYCEANFPRADEFFDAETHRLILNELNQCGATIIDIDDFYEKYLKKFKDRKSVV